MVLLEFLECCLGGSSRMRGPRLCSVAFDWLLRINKLNFRINAADVIVFTGPFTCARLCPPRDPVWR